MVKVKEQVNKNFGDKIPENIVGKENTFPNKKSYEMRR